MKEHRGLFLALALLFQILSPALSLGGGVSSAVEIDRIERHAFGDFTLVIRLLKADSGTRFGDCEVATIEGGYSFFRWLFVSTPDELNWENHKAALEKLVTAQQKQTSMRFGAMGAGLKKRAEGSGCVWESRGLTVLSELDGVDAVYSFYEWP